MNARQSVTLSREQETLLVPLLAKARENPIFEDPKAEEILSQLDYDFKQLKVPKKTSVTLCIRARQLDTYAKEFIDAHPNAVIIHLGCGLDSRCERVRQADSTWYDLDLPDVIELRRKFYPQTASYHLIASSVTDFKWLDKIDAQGHPVLVIAEGLFMYIPESELHQLVQCLHEKFPGASLVFDAFSQMTANRIKAHPSIQKTGAVVHWGIDDPHELETWAPGIRLKEEWFFSQSPDIDKLGAFYQLMFRLTGSMLAVQRAQRILYYNL